MMFGIHCTEFECYYLGYLNCLMQTSVHMHTHAYALFLILISLSSHLSDLYEICRSRAEDRIRLIQESKDAPGSPESGFY